MSRSRLHNIPQKSAAEVRNRKNAGRTKQSSPAKPIVFDSEPSTSTPRILIATTMWKRPEIFEFWAERMKPLKCDVLVVGSEGELSRSLAEKYEFAYMEYPNEPLGAKFNARIDYFLEHPEYTHILLVGSDDIICPRTLRIIEEKIHQYDIVNWRDIYYYEWETGRIVYSRGYTNHRKGEPFAPGRCLSRRAVEKLGGRLWNKDLTAAPDGHLWTKLKRFENQITLSCKENDCVIMDVKSSQNRTPLDTLLARKMAVPTENQKVRYLVKNVRLGENVLLGKNVEIGRGTVVMNNVEIRDNVSIGQNCYVDSGVIVTGEATIGDNVTLRNYVVVARGSKIGDGSFLAPRVMFNNLDSEKKKIGGAAVGRKCFIGTNTVLHHGIHICDNVTIGALSFVNKDITEEGVYVGQPAQKIR